MNPFQIFIATLFSKGNESLKMNKTSIYDIPINTLHRNPIELSNFKGKHILFVNVASRCGFTPQYKNLQAMHEQYKDKLQIIGVPCNQFGSQEPGDETAIASFCEVNYGVTFLLTEKVDVKGKNQHPLYTWLTQKTHNNKRNSKVKWNFQKYLVDDNGHLVDYFFSTTNPLSSKITKHLK